MMKKKPTRKYAAGGMAPTQVQKAVAAASSNKPSAAEATALAKMKAVLTTKEKAQYLKGSRRQFREDSKSGAFKENVQAQKKDMRAALKSGAVPKEARKSLRDEIKNTNVKSVAQGVRSKFAEARENIKAERANNKAIRKSLKGK
jgi:hypothetical protein